jgi:hypothetical protein
LQIRNKSARRVNTITNEKPSQLAYFSGDERNVCGGIDVVFVHSEKGRRDGLPVQGVGGEVPWDGGLEWGEVGRGQRVVGRGVIEKPSTP